MQLNDWVGELEEFRLAQKLPSLELLIHAGGDEIVHCSNGYFDIHEKRLLQNNSIFNVASITKILTILAIYKLENENILGLDQKIFDHISYLLPSVVDDRLKEVTYEQLIFHESGLGFGLPVYEDGAIMLDLILENPLLQDPGTGFKYSNLGFLLLGFAIEQLTGQRYASYIREHFLQPLEMIDSGFSSESYHIKKNCPSAYQAKDVFRDVKNLEDFRKCDEFRMADPSSGLYTTSKDLLKLMRFLQGVESTSVMQEIQGLPIQEVLFRKNECRKYMRVLYGPGFFQTKSAGHYVAFVSGFSIGYSSLVCMIPELDITLIAMTNQSYAQSQLTVLGMGLIYSYLTRNMWQIRQIIKRVYQMPEAYQFYYAQDKKMQLLIWTGNSAGVYLYHEGKSIKLEFIDHDLAIHEDLLMMLFLDISQNKIQSIHFNGTQYLPDATTQSDNYDDLYHHLTGVYENSFFGKIWIQAKNNAVYCIQGNQRAELIPETRQRFRMKGSLFFDLEFLTFSNFNNDEKPYTVRFSGLDFSRITR
ncbi:serine hydrolase domain-containing protein [Pedobacter psychrotolerans]|uniref:serine hydrolase domain-containing protein n=1 Tax=Pedobacter psychrotolerans TaxID=1843235 RepID=UPI003F9A90DD